MGGVSDARFGAMPSSTLHRILPVAQMNAEWAALGRSPCSVRALHRLAERDEPLSVLVHGSGAPPCCPTPTDLIDHMRRAKGRRNREEAAALVRVMLREATVDPLVTRFLLQALLPGMMSVAKRLQWGMGGEWQDGSEFFGELIATAWDVVTDWSGQDRPYAVLDLLSALRCRMRRQLLRAKDLQHQQVGLSPDVTANITSPHETDLEQLARLLIELRRSGMRTDEVEVLYAQHVLGFTISELALVTGRDRRALYARRDRGHRRLCA
jgi:hypothetical protein